MDNRASLLPISRGSVVDSELDALMQAHPNETRELVYELYNIPAPGKDHSPRQDETSVKKFVSPTGRTHYEDTYIPKNGRKRSSKRPQGPTKTDKNNEKQPMTFETWQKSEFVPKDLAAAKNVPLRKSENAATEPTWQWPAGEFGVASSVYHNEFHPHALDSPTRVTRADMENAGNKKHLFPSGQFDGQTTNQEFYKGWKSGKNNIQYGDLPSFTGSVLYPSGKTMEVDSVTKSTYKGPKGVPAQPAIPAHGNITLDGQHDFQTVMRDTFKPMPSDAYKDRLLHPAHENEIVVDRKMPFHAQTQSRTDYKGIDAKAHPRPKPASPPPATINLKYDSQGYWGTEQRQVFHGHDVTQHPIPASHKKEASKYTAPTEKLDGNTVTKLDFQPKDIHAAYQERAKPPKPTTKFAGAFDHVTTNNDFYRPRQSDVCPRQRHGDFHLAYQSLPKPKLHLFDGVSETKDAFITKSLSTTQNFKPAVNAIEKQGEHDFNTMYRSQYIQPRFKLTREEAAHIKDELRRLHRLKLNGVKPFNALPEVAKG